MIQRQAKPIGSNSSRNVLKKFFTAPIVNLLRQAALRRRVVFEIKQEYFEELEFNVPLSHHFSCPIYSPEAWCSFSEIFFGDEYTPVFESIPLPDRWLDLGCHMGYFSLLVIWLRAKRGLDTHCNALLVDADSHSIPAIEKLIAVNHLEKQLSFRHGLISRHDREQLFIERGFMASSVAELTEAGLGKNAKPVNTLCAEQIIAILPPPYDLIKIDVEGSEYDFLIKYGSLIAQTKYLLLEWHSWHKGGRGLTQIHELALEHGFTVHKEVVPAHTVQLSSGAEQCGVILYTRG
jgi:FkbM family methyltransferase